MGRCPPELLDDLASVLGEALAWPGIVEKSPGVLYHRRQPFLHFHLFEGGRRRADVRGRGGWTSLEVPRPISAAKRLALRRLLLGRYRERAPEPRLVRMCRARDGRVPSSGEGCAQAEWDPLVLRAARRAAIQASG